MSYIPEPYLEIVDDLLTGLTGGIVHEEHVFDPDILNYLLVNTPAEIDSIKISGRVNEQFHVFVPLQDFIPGEEDINWLNGAGVNKPDKGTTFYINYYPKDATPLLTDRNVGSITRLFAESFGREFAILHQQLDLVYRSGFVDTAEDRALEQVVAILGIQRKTAQFAVGNVIFSRNLPAPADIFIPAGLQVSTDTDPIVVFETSIQRMLRKNQLSVVVPVKATVEGEAGIVDANRIAVINQPILGIDAVTNSENTVLGTKPESDEQLRRRAKFQLEKAGKTTLNALKYALLAIRSQSGDNMLQLKENDIKIMEDFSHGPGLVRILLDADEGNQNLAREVNRAIFETRAAGIAVVHNLNLPTGEPGGEGSSPSSEIERDEATEAALATRAALAAAATETGASEEDTEQLIVDLKKVTVEIKMTISLVDISLSESEKNKIVSSVQDGITEFFDALNIGEKVIINRLLNTVMNVEGVENIIRLIWIAHLPSGETIDGSRFDIHVPQNQKAELDPEDIEIKIAGSPVRVDLTVNATITGSSDLPQSKVENEIELKLATFFDALEGDLDLSLLQQALAGNEYEITTIEANVEYTETGLIIRNVEQLITISENEIAVTGIVRIHVTGGFEGA